MELRRLLCIPIFLSCRYIGRLCRLSRNSVKKIKVVGATKLKYNFEKERCLIKNLSHLKIKDPSVCIDSMSSKA